MSAIGSISTAATALRENPVILGAALLFTLFGESYVLLEAYGGSIAQLLSFPIAIFAMPFVLGGFITVVNDGLDGSARFESFVRGGTENYVALFGATIIFAVTVFAFVFASMILMIFVGFGTVAAGGGAGAVLLVSALLLLLFAIVFLFVQFYDVAIVVSGVNAVDSFSKSVGLVRQNFVSVVGFTLVFVAISLLGQGPGTALYLSAVESGGTGQTAVTSESTLFLSIAVSLVFGTLGTAFAYTYLVAYYRSLVERDPTAVPAN